MEAPEIVALVGDWVSGQATSVTALVEDVGAAVRVARVLRGALLEPVVGYLVGLVALMGAACAGFGAALGRVVLGREI